MERQYGAIDKFKVIAALLVVAIHTSPLASFNGTADYLLTRVLARIAVPFFFMVTGFFIFPQCSFKRSFDKGTLLRFIKKTALLYLFATVLYIPINVYAGHFQGISLWDAVKMLFFDGTFYHLWYLPALILGATIIFLLSKKVSSFGMGVVCLILYAIGLLGDSYYGLISGVPYISKAYDAAFKIFSYTRNGLFFAPVFIFLGGVFSGNKHRVKRLNYAVGLTMALTVMAAEGIILRNFGLQRHDSMYITLPFCMYFLFGLVISFESPSSVKLRDISTWVYILHPLLIVVVRGIAKIVKLEALIENSLLHYFAVSLLSFLAAWAMTAIPLFKSKKVFRKGRAWIELSRNNLQHNVEMIKTLLPDGCELMPAIKANAYGHGAVLIARELNALGVQNFCVATVHEGAELRKGGITGNILVLGYTYPADFGLLRKYTLTQTVVNTDYAVSLNSYGKKLCVQIKLDTGMHRLGQESDCIEDIGMIFTMKNLKIEGIYTHLCADDTDNMADRQFTLGQKMEFDRAVERLNEMGFYVGKKHILSSYGVVNYPEFGGDFARVGIGLYGMLSEKVHNENCDLDLRGVLSLKARVALVRTIEKDESAGYGLAFKAQRETKLAVLTIGYADGYPRTLGCGVGSVLLRGKRAPIAGKICMDQLMVDVTEIPGVTQGDEAVLIGCENSEEITACDLAELSGTIANEILSRLGTRLERIVV